MTHFLLLIIGGALGTLLRFAFSVLFAGLGGFPYATLTVNFIGCFLIGVFSVWAETKWALDGAMRALFMIGFCGALTTFSTFLLEIADLLRSEQTLKAFLYLFISLVLGFGLLKAGILFAQK